MRPAILLLFVALSTSTGVGAADIALIGVMGDKAAVLAAGGGEPKTVKVGQKWMGVTVLSVEREQATVEIDGRQRVLKIGQHYRAGPSASGRQSVTLSADTRGHFFADGAINGSPVRFMVDTGATAIALPASEALRLGIDYRKGQRGLSNTANGVVPFYRVRLDTVTIGGIELTGVDAGVVEGGLNVVLLGMSFLNRVEMRREGDLMTLERRF